MRLTELEPTFVDAGGDGIYNSDGTPATPRFGVGLASLCPCGCGDRLYVAFANPIDGGSPYINEGQPIWDRVGESFETLTLSPSILRVGGCGWHGFIRDGEIIIA